MYNCGLVVLLWVGKPQKRGKMPFARTFNDHQTAALGLSMHPHEETGIMTKTDSQQTMVIAQKTVNDIIEYGKEIIE